MSEAREVERCESYRVGFVQILLYDCLFVDVVYYATLARADEKISQLPVREKSEVVVGRLY
jgi:hypothetical protein